jgi:hypothetical protein
MTTLNLDLEVARRAIEKMTIAYGMLTNYQKKNRTLLLTDLLEAEQWKGASAKDFNDNYKKVDYENYLQLEAYGQLIQVLAGEVAQWEHQASHLSPDPKYLFPPGNTP